MTVTSALYSLATYTRYSLVSCAGAEDDRTARDDSAAAAIARREWKPFPRCTNGVLHRSLHNADTGDFIRLELAGRQWLVDAKRVQIVQSVVEPGYRREPDDRIPGGQRNGLPHLVVPRPNTHRKRFGAVNV